MENLKNAITQELHLIIKGIVSAYEFNETIDERYLIEWNIEAYEEYFKVSYEWTKGVIPGTNGNPIYSSDSTCITERSYFKVGRMHSLSKFTKEVIAAIEEVCKEPFDELAEA